MFNLNARQLIQFVWHAETSESQKLTRKKTSLLKVGSIVQASWWLKNENETLTNIKGWRTVYCHPRMDRLLTKTHVSAQSWEVANEPSWKSSGQGRWWVHAATGGSSRWRSHSMSRLCNCGNRSMIRPIVGMASQIIERIEKINFLSWTSLSMLAMSENQRASDRESIACRPGQYLRDTVWSIQGMQPRNTRQTRPRIRQRSDSKDSEFGHYSAWSSRW